MDSLTLSARRSIKRMYKRGLSIEEIVKLTKFSRSQVEKALREPLF